MHTSAETGEPQLVNMDRYNEALAESQKYLGLQKRHSNLCSESTLPTGEDRTAVCCLSSVNLEYFDEWKDHPMFIADLVTMLDNIIEQFIDNSVHHSVLNTVFNHVIQPSQQISKEHRAVSYQPPQTKETHPQLILRCLS